MARGRPALKPGTHGEITYDNPAPRKWKTFARLRLYDGRIVKVKATADTKSNARDALEKRCEERLGTANATEITPTTKLSELLSRWLGQHDIAERSRGIYETAISKHINPGLGELRLNELSPPLIQVFIDAQTPGVAPTCRSVLSNALNYAVRVGAIQSSPWRAITLPKTEAKAVEIISKTEEEAYIAAVRRWCTGLDPNQEDDEEPAGRPGRGGGLTNIMRVIAGSGVRTSEALGLRIQDVDPKARRITVCGQSTARGTRTPVLKNRTSRFSHRVISITEDAADAIQEQLEDDAVQFWGEPLFPSRSGTYRTANNLNRDLRDATERLREDLKRDIVPRDFRSTVGTRIRDKYGVDAAQLHLGHATNAVTQKYYLAAPDEIADYMSGLE